MLCMFCLNTDLNLYIIQILCALSVFYMYNHVRGDVYNNCVKVQSKMVKNEMSLDHFECLLFFLEHNIHARFLREIITPVSFLTLKTILIKTKVCLSNCS